MPKPLRAYWDACAWLGLINGEPRKRRELEIVWNDALAGKTEIWTSALTMAEVFKKRCEDADPKPLSEENDAEIERLFNAPHVKVAQVDMLIGRHARRLLRQHPELAKPNDAIHLATALRWDCDVLHTYDGANLLVLNGRLTRKDGSPLRISMPDVDTDGPLFGAPRAVRGDGSGRRIDLAPPPAPDGGG